MRVGLIDDVSVARVSVSTPAKLVRSTYVFFFRTFSRADILYIIFSPSPRIFHSFSFVWFFFFFNFTVIGTLPRVPLLYSHYTYVDNKYNRTRARDFIGTFYKYSRHMVDIRRIGTSGDRRFRSLTFI